MSIDYTLDIAYSFRRTEALLTAVAGVTDSKDAATLASIEQLLVKAAGDYRARRFTASIDGYTRARQLIWGQLFPLTEYKDRIVDRLDVSKPLFSYAVEWLNVLPVEQGLDGVRPRETMAVDAPVYGLLSNATGATEAAAVADYRLSQTLKANGATESSAFFLERANAEAPRLIEAITKAESPKPEVADPAEPVPVVGGPVIRRRVGRGLNLDGDGVEHFAAGGDGFGVALTRKGAFTAGLFDAIADPVVVGIPPQLTAQKRTYSFPVGDGSKSIAWAEGSAPDATKLQDVLYASRVKLKFLPDVLLEPKKPADVAAGLAHAWYYETTLGLAEDYHALGQWAAAETWYLKAASYTYLNAAIEAPYVWARLANLYLDWGDALFRADDPAAALPVYEKVLTADGAAPDASLYTLEPLAPAADQARQAIAHLDDPSAITASPAITAVLFDVWSRLAKISGGLDFWGHWAQQVPIWTFDYLQSVAVNFCQLAIGAERDSMTFWEKADSGELTRTQLTQNITQSAAELQAAQRAVAAANAEVAAYRAGQDVANLRAQDARDNADEYTAKSWDWTMHQALSQQMSGGEDGNASQLNSLADRMSRGGYSLSGDRGTLSAAESLTAARQQREYEIDAMRRQAAELEAAAVQAGAEVAASQARAAATQAQANAAAVRVQNAQQLLAAFDDQRFTPDVWNALGDRMSQISGRYLAMALDVAKRMQRAYNFENDVAMAVIRPDYTASAVHGLLASDALMADVQSFTYDLITSTAPKPQPVSQTISLAERYPFLFETQLRRTGRMEFQTDLDDFDAKYPGTYAGRIEAVEVAVDGIVPARGLSGTLSNAGISHYRVPSTAGGATKHRVQTRETLVLSDFDLRRDALLDHPDARRLRVFEGAGVASSWTLEFPKAANELQFASLIDVRLTFTYTARFDPDLKEAVLEELANRPAANDRTRPFPLRWAFADAFFAFYSTGVLDFSLDRTSFSATETLPVLTGLSLIASTTPAPGAEGLVLRVTAPGSAPVTVTTAADGSVDATALQAAVTGQSAFGAYRIQVDPGDNPDRVHDGALELDDIDNIALILAYSFTPRA
ncbi:tetratricopeptide repeat protein [Microbacterium sp. 4R-513]|uniref:tetratricopeptide repeat protein n=1 Tax=Microbacterium sp. 4R-513 TaxID=2567934 RepID=UPI0013E1CF41|nr:tetratricopeptide repeat protein [Microbacterium sp. 4R-513]QIG39964.1 tetratricopeptide repeat protein [Microbacterium sp. 4R-513]